MGTTKVRITNLEFVSGLADGKGREVVVQQQGGAPEVIKPQETREFEFSPGDYVYLGNAELADGRKIHEMYSGQAVSSVEVEVAETPAKSGVTGSPETEVTAKV